MKVDSRLAKLIGTGEFIVTAECALGAITSGTAAEAALKALGSRPVAVGAADNPHGVGLSSLAVCVLALKSGVEPVLQIVTRDRNRIALQSDLLGAAIVGVKNVLCMSGYHQSLAGCPESANVFDVDSTQLIEFVSRMSEKGTLADGKSIDGQFSMLVGAVANPFLKPIELNMLRLGKKIEAGARFILTHPVFDVKSFSLWLDAASKEGLTGKAAILAGVYPLESAEEASRLRDTYAEFHIPDEVIDRLKRAGDAGRKEGLAICAETIKELKKLKNLRGIHIHSGGKESLVPEIIAASGL